MTTETLWFMDAELKILLSRGGTDDGLSIMQHRMHGGFATPLHVHHDEDETFYVLDGDFRFQADDTVRDASAGDVVHIPHGTTHSFRVLSPEGGRCLTLTRGGFEQMVREASRPPLGRGMPARVTEPTPAMVAELAAIATRNGIDLLGPPRV